VPPNKRMKLTSLSAAPGRRERRLVRPSGRIGGRTGSQLIRGVRWTSRGVARRTRPGVPMPTTLRCWSNQTLRCCALSSPAARARTRQLIGQNRQLMSVFAKSGA
jgi:hypothetical protein